MQKKKPARINYRINYCASEDSQYPVSELLLQSPDAKGWQSKRFCSYPQIIILQLVEPSVIKQISVLSHQSKIATKIQIQTKADPNKQWKRLGYMSLQSNVNTNYQARQLRTVKISDITSILLRFTMHTNYVNNHNIFNQVGLISLCVYGENTSGNKQMSQPGFMMPTKNIGGQFDKYTMQKLKALQQMKKQAVQNQQYDRAKQIKDQIQRIKNNGFLLVQLQKKKQQAIKNENYEDAKVLNEKMKRIRDSNGGQPSSTTKHLDTNSDYYKKSQKQKYYGDQQKSSVSPITPIKQNKQPQKQMAKQINQYPKKKDYDHDQHVIAVKKQNPYENQGQDQYQDPQQKQGELEPLNKQLKAQIYPYFDIFDQQTFRHLYSRNIQNREEGLRRVRTEIQSSSSSKDKLSAAALYVIKSTIDDKATSVLLNVLETFDFVMKKYKPANNPQNQVNIDYILEKLSDYLGHNNEKIKQLSEDIYLNLPNFQLTNKDTCYRILTILGKRQKPPKILTGRLKILGNIVQSYQLGKNYEDVIRYAVKYVDDKNSEVRNMAINLISSISKQIGYGTVQGYLKNIRPQILKIIEEKLDTSDTQNMGDQRPIKSTKQLNKSREKIPVHNKYQEQMQGDNQFIQVKSKKTVSNPQFMCQYCDQFDKRFEDQNYRDLHLFNACPMLTICHQCKQAVQIPTYTAHLLGQCDNSKFYKRCPRCKQAVTQKNYKSHVESKQCIPAKPPAQAGRCPLCHLDIKSGMPGWKQHLVTEGCDNNPRS